MTVELQMLVYVSLLSIVMAFPPLAALALENGLGVAGRNRDESFTMPVWGERAARAQWNLIANLPAFAAVVLVAQASGRLERDDRARCAALLLGPRRARSDLSCRHSVGAGARVHRESVGVLPHRG
jgi:uncharacterized MAPEG superfamily protein